MLPVEMKDNVRDHLDAPDNFWSDEIIWRRMQEAQGELIRDISKEDPSYFVETYDITLPMICLQMPAWELESSSERTRLTGLAGSCHLHDCETYCLRLSRLWSTCPRLTTLLWRALR